MKKPSSSSWPFRACWWCPCPLLWFISFHSFCAEGMYLPLTYQLDFLWPQGLCTCCLECSFSRSLHFIPSYHSSLTLSVNSLRETPACPKYIHFRSSFYYFLHSSPSKIILLCTHLFIVFQLGKIHFVSYLPVSLVPVAMSDIQLMLRKYLLTSVASGCFDSLRWIFPWGTWPSD